MSSIATVQFETAQQGRRLGVVRGERVVDITAADPNTTRVLDACRRAAARRMSLSAWLTELADQSSVTIPYAALLANRTLAEGPVLHPPVDHADPHRVLITGTGLTHLGSMQSRDSMHTAVKSTHAPEPPITDSRKMFEWGLEGGRPAPGTRGVAPEWFYKGNGTILRGPGEPLEIPDFTIDGGEEPEIVGCYLIDDAGRPVRLGFALGNEWSDHAVEKLNYLYLAPSKLRTCAVGPELVVDHDFQEIELRCTASRQGELLYDSGVLWSGERHMCHTLANLEDHHFKYPQHRVPGDVHLYFFGTSRLSFGSRTWRYAEGDVLQITSPGFSSPLVNSVRKQPESPTPARVYPA